MVTLQRILRSLNILTGAAVVAAAGAGYWYLWRPLPQSSGIAVAPVRAEVAIARDRLGIPHIRAASLEDALFAEGYATAQDRLWQMDMARRVAGGEVSEVAGAAGLALDTRSHRLRMQRIAEAQARQLSDAARAQLAAYARGVNAYIEAHSDALPLEFHLMDYTPRPWRIADSLLILLAMNQTLTDSWEKDLAKWRSLQEGSPDRVERLYPLRSGGEISPGSNAWALAGTRSKSGRPLLANDPHLDYAVPSTWYAVHLKAPGLNVIGVTLPGAPGVLIGHNERIAWGITALQYDTQDLYVERFDARAGRYAYRGEVRQAERDVDWIAIRGVAPQRLETWVTVHGPVVQAENGHALALRWAAADPDPSYPVLALDQTRNWSEFRAALGQFAGPGLNFLYADVDGNIGHQVAGRLPLRRNFDGDVPVDGANGANEWAGYVPFDQLPSEFNPGSGVLISANQNPFPANAPYRVNGRFAAPYRQRQIHDRLLSHSRWAPAELTSVQRDVYSAPLRFVVREAVRAARSNAASAARLQDAIVRLEGWNGQMNADGSAPMIAVLTYQQLRRRIGAAGAPRTGASYADEMAPAVVESLLRERPRGWFTNWDATIIDAFSDAVEEAGRMQGHRAEHWNYGRMHEVQLRHPLSASLGWFDRFFSIGPVEMDGDATTVRQVTRNLGPSLRFIATPGSWDDSLLTLTTGESGQAASPHYKDQWPEYRDGGALKLEFERVDARSTLLLRPR